MPGVRRHNCCQKAGFGTVTQHRGTEELSGFQFWVRTNDPIHALSDLPKQSTTVRSSWYMMLTAAY